MIMTFSRWRILPAESLHYDW